MLPPVPARMDAEIDHDGVVWHPLRRPEGAVVALVGALLVGGVAAGAGMVAFAHPGAAVAGALGGALPTLVALLPSALRRERVELRRDRIWITRGREPRSEVLLDRCEVKVSATGREPALAIRTRDGVEVVGAGNPPEHLAWFGAAVAVAKEQLERQRKEDGRELFTHREEAKRVTGILER